MNMTPEEMNTQLYEKLTAEQAKYRDWLMGQPPEEILNHAYEYAVREDILAAAELMDMQSGLPLRPVCPQGMGGVSWPGRRAAGCVLAHGGHLWGVDRTEKF